LTGTLQLEGGNLAVTLVAVSLAVGALALLLIIMRRTVGAIVCMVFYGLQIFSVALPSGSKWGFNSLPTMYWRIHGDKNFPTNLNVVALVIFCLSLALWVSYRQRDGHEAAAAPNKLLERTRDS
jgi:hypothetical protein